MGYNWKDFADLAPLIVFVIGGCTLLMSEVFMKGNNRSYQAGVSAAFAALAGVIAWNQVDVPAHDLFAGFARADAFGAYTTVLISATLFLTALVSQSYLKTHASERGEFHALAQFAAAGMVLLSITTDLLTIFIAIEVMSLAVYALVAWIRSTPRTAEASLKYFVLGSFASAIFLYGAALAYGAAGSTRIADVAAAFGHAPSGLLVASLALMATGLLFKVGAVPFHTWVPDVYDGAPSPVTGFMAAGVKIAAFAALLRVFFAAFGSEAFSLGIDGGRGWYEALKWVALATMVVGNVLALAQPSVKRMLAYSSIAHAGYILVTVVIGAKTQFREAATHAALFYLAIYVVAVIGAFAVCAALEKRGLVHPDDDGRYDGLSERHPGFALAMSVFLFSMAGVPPTAGFLGKFFIFRAALDAGEIALTVVGFLASVAGLYYYLRVVVQMYMKPSRANAPTAVWNRMFAVGVTVSAVATLVFGILPAWLSDFAHTAATLGALTP